MMHGIGVIGLGLMGRRFAAGVNEHPWLGLAAAYDPLADPKVEPAVRVADAKAVVDHPGVSCVYIATPPATHRGLVELASRAGKAIFCEKPLAPSPTDAAAAFAAIESSRVPAAVNFPHATAAAALELQRLVASGELGKSFEATLTLRFAQWPRDWQATAGEWLRGPAEGGLTREVFSHFAFLAIRLFGRATLKQSLVEWGPTTETAMRCIIEFAGARLTVDAAVEGSLDDFNRLEVRGEHGQAVLSDWYKLAIGERRIAPPGGLNGQLDELARMLDGQPHLLATFAEACQVAELVEAILAR